MRVPRREEMLCATSLQRGQAVAWPRWREVAAQKI